jgi:hypothetical protein
MTIGVPDISPVWESIFNPGGSNPVLTVHVTGSTLVAATR